MSSGVRRQGKPKGWYSKEERDARRADAKARKEKKQHHVAGVVERIARSARRKVAKLTLATAIKAAEELRASERGPAPKPAGRSLNVRPVRRGESRHTVVSEHPINSVVGQIVLPDPMPSVSSTSRQTIKVDRQLRTDVLARMHDGGTIGEMQYMAGRRWQALLERATIGGGSPDPTRPIVDGGRVGEPFTAQVRKAVAELVRIDKVLGREGAKIVRLVLADGCTFEEAARARGWADASGHVPRRNADAMSYRLREILKTLATEFNLSTRRNRRPHGTAHSADADDRLQDRSGMDAEADKGGGKSTGTVPLQGGDA